ncbi:uncharacterized protein [Parasteatoda tepidariorum]|nr:uncharacterized protein LOC107441416 isoform X2 [Parasteatoda tepidariorum]
MMSFLDKMYQEHSDNLPRKKNLPVIQPFTSQPVIITVPKNRGLRPIAPKIEESTTSKSSMSPDVYDGNQDSVTENESEEQLPQEPEIYLVTPTLFNEGERTLFKNSLNTPKRKASHSIQDEETVVISSQAKRAAREEDTLLRRQEFEYRLQWDEKEHFLRVKCQEEEHKMKMKVEQAKLRVEEENLRIKEQKLKVLIAKEAYFKSLIKTSNAE